MLIHDRHLVGRTSLLDTGGFALDNNGYLNITARIARTGLHTYSGDEIPGGHFKDRKIVHVLRPASEVFAKDALASFANLPITLGHPPSGVSSDNYKQTAVGVSTGTPVRDGAYMKVELSIRDADTVAQIIAAGGMQISNGYTVDLDTTSGTTSGGDRYDAIQRNIRGNHIALVDAARCGPACRIGDGISDCTCASCQQQKEQGMSKNQINTDEGEEILKPTIVPETPDTIESLKAKVAGLEAVIAGLRGEIAALKAEQSVATMEKKVENRVAERVALLTAANSILSDQDFSSKSDSDIRKAVITHKYGANMLVDADTAAIKG
ncbi:MAG: DUF2213 domain-containing protein, partial [Acidimicrobiales bacterium]